MNVLIEDDASFESAAEYVKAIKAQVKKVTEFFKPMKEAAYRAHRHICERENMMLEPLKNADGVMQKAMGGYMRIKEIERQRAEAEVRRLAEEEAYRKLQEAEKLASEGKHEEAKAMEEDAMVVDSAVSAISLQADMPKVKGVYQTVDYVVTVTNSMLVPLSMNGVEIRPIDMKALKQLAKMSKGKVQIPGVVITEEIGTRVVGGRGNV